MKRYNALEYALYLLQNRAQTEKQLRDKLARKKFEQTDIDQTILKLAKAGYVNDEQFAHNYAQDKVRLNRRGRFRIALELLQKGVSKELIKKSTDQINETDELEAARSLIAAKKRQWQHLDPQKVYLRTVSLLTRRGFSAKIVKELTKRQTEE